MDDICGNGVCLDCWLSVRRPIWPTTSQLAPNGPVQPCLAEHCFSCRFDVYVLCFLLCCFGVINNNNKHTHIFYPFAIETCGTWHEMAIEFTQEIGRCITTITEDTRETTFQRLSMALQRRNAVSFHNAMVTE